jgi:hypothetical protein
MTDETPPAPEDRVAELERRLADLETSSAARLLHADLKSHAARAGMIDLDGLRLIDTTSLKLNDQGEVEGASKLMSELRRSKPWLFQSANSSSPAAAPPSTQPAAKRATEMTHAEWQRARAELLKQR